MRSPSTDLLDQKTARSVLRDAARRHLRLNAYAALRQHDRRMPSWAFHGIIGFLAVTRLLCIVTLTAAWQGWLLDPRFWATGATLTADHHTPFHGHPNLFGWRFGFQGLVAAHNVTGILLFAVCLVPLFVAKGSPMHVRFGRAFVAFWLLHLFDGLVNSGQLLLARGFEPSHYLDSTHQGFSLYLYIQFCFISSMVVDFLANGLAALQYKNQVPSRGMRALMLALPATSLLFGVGMMVWGVVRLAGVGGPASPSAQQFAVIFVAQVPAYLYLLYKNISYWARPTARAWLHGWVTEHQRNMMFCVQVTLYTGAANATMKWAPWLTPILFISVDVGFIVWLLIKERSIRRSVMGARVGFAVVSLLRSGGREAKAAVPLPAADQRWIMKAFDLDGDGTLSGDEVKAMLAKQGIDLSDEETERVMASLDRDGDGVVDREELGAFLSEWLSADPTYDDDLALAFRALDKNGDGRLDAEELREALKGPDGTIDKTGAHEVLADLVDRKGGKVEWEEFQRAVASGRRHWKQPWMPTGEAGKRGMKALTDEEVEAHERARRSAG